MDFCGFSLFKSCSKNKKDNIDSSKSTMKNELSKNNAGNEMIQNSNRNSIDRNSTSDEHKISNSDQGSDNRSEMAAKKVANKIAANVKKPQINKTDPNLSTTEENKNLEPNTNKSKVELNESLKHDEEIANNDCEVDPLNAAEDIKQWLVKNDHNQRIQNHLQDKFMNRQNKEIHQDIQQNNHYNTNQDRNSLQKRIKF